MFDGAWCDEMAKTKYRYVDVEINLGQMYCDSQMGKTAMLEAQSMRPTEEFRSWRMPFDKMVVQPIKMPADTFTPNVDVSYEPAVDSQPETRNSQPAPSIHPDHAPDSSYFPAAVNADSRDKAIEYVVGRLESESFDVVACRGVSGATMAAVVAYKLHKDLCIVRKPNDGSHSSYTVEGPTGRYVIVDDFISTGATVKEIVKQITRVDPHAECLGVICYGKHYWREMDGDDAKSCSEWTGVPCLY